jgi:hypothetical protein
MTHHSGVKAAGVEEDEEFVVLKGSQALKDAGYQGNNSYGELTQGRITRGVLAASTDDKFYEFVLSYSFKSPSAAAAVVLDRNSNGRPEWKILGSKLTYHQWQEEKAKASEIGEAADLA